MTFPKQARTSRISFTSPCARWCSKIVVAWKSHTLRGIHSHQHRLTSQQQIHHYVTRIQRAQVKTESFTPLSTQRFGICPDIESRSLQPRYLRRHSAFLLPALNACHCHMASSAFLARYTNNQNTLIATSMSCKTLERAYWKIGGTVSVCNLTAMSALQHMHF